MEDILTALKHLDQPDLFKVIKSALADAEKKAKSSKPGKEKKEKKTGSAPKGKVPDQLKKPRAWVDFTLKHAIENGWEEFTITQKKKDKDTAQVTEEEIVMPPSQKNDDGAWVYEGSITDKTPKGRQIIHKEAMSLSKQRKQTAHHTYAQFDLAYVPEDDDDNKSQVSLLSSKTVVRKTVAEKEAERDAKNAQKEALKLAQKAQKDADKEHKKALKLAEKEADKALKLAEKEAKKHTTLKIPKNPLAPTHHTNTLHSDPLPSIHTQHILPNTSVKLVKKQAPKKQEDNDIIIPDDGCAHPWTFKGKHYLRTHDNCVWVRKSDNSMGPWAGMYDHLADKIDDSVEEPLMEDD